jgi:hypothetical protein
MYRCIELFIKETLLWILWVLGILVLNKITWLRLIRVVVGLRIKFTPNKMWFLDLTIMIKGCVITHSQDEWMMIG